MRLPAPVASKQPIHNLRITRHEHRNLRPTFALGATSAPFAVGPGAHEPHTFPHAKAETKAKGICRLEIAVRRSHRRNSRRPASLQAHAAAEKRTARRTEAVSPREHDPRQRWSRHGQAVYALQSALHHVPSALLERPGRREAHTEGALRRLSSAGGSSGKMERGASQAHKPGAE